MYSDKDLLFIVPENSLLEQARGEFAKRVLVLARAEPDFPKNFEFLSKILLAAGLSLEKDTLFAAMESGKQSALLPVLKTKQPESILIFGILPEEMGLRINCPLYQAFVFYGSSFLFADKLSTLEPDKTLKTKLWQALQQLFR